MFSKQLQTLVNCFHLDSSFLQRYSKSLCMNRLGHTTFYGTLHKMEKVYCFRANLSYKVRVIPHDVRFARELAAIPENRRSRNGGCFERPLGSSNTSSPHSFASSSSAWRPGMWWVRGTRKCLINPHSNSRYVVTENSLS